MAWKLLELTVLSPSSSTPATPDAEAASSFSRPCWHLVPNSHHRTDFLMPAASWVPPVPQASAPASAPGCRRRQRSTPGWVGPTAEAHRLPAAEWHQQRLSILSSPGMSPAGSICSRLCWDALSLGIGPKGQLAIQTPHCLSHKLLKIKFLKKVKLAGSLPELLTTMPETPSQWTESFSSRRSKVLWTESSTFHPKGDHAGSAKT